MTTRLEVDPDRLRMIAVQRFGSIDALGSFLLRIACSGIPESHLEKFDALWRAYQEICEESSKPLHQN